MSSRREARAARSSASRASLPSSPRARFRHETPVMTRGPAPRSVQRAPLRARAESTLRADNRPLAEADGERIEYELRVHEVELQIQNDDLRAAQLALEESRDR